MKKITLLATLALGLLGWQPAPAQSLPSQTSATGAPTLSAGQQIAAAQASYEAWDQPDQAIGPNHRTTIRDTKTGPHPIVELATGMNYWDGQQWQASQPAFQAVSDGFYAGKLQDPVHLAGNLCGTNAVSIRTPEGIPLNSTPVALALYDAASGNFSVIAGITNCTGVLVNSNQVVYPDAFSGVCASLIYTISAGTFNQDVVFTGPLDPADYGFPRATTRIQIITEFYDAPTPDQLLRPLYVEGNAKVRAKMASPDLLDEQLGFGRFVLTTGKAYVMPDQQNTNGLAALVAKEYKTIEGRTFLFESVPYTAIAQALTNLPPCHPLSGSIKLKSTQGYAGIPHPGGKFKTAGVILEARNTQVSGVVIDYVANIGGTMSGTTVFKGDTTYLVSSAVSCNGPTIIEGGAVFKYKSNASISLNSSLTCKTGLYRPAIFTAVDDDTVGDTMNGVSGSGYTGTISSLGYANPALYAPSAMTFNGLRIRYAKEAIQVLGNGITWTISNAQLVNCIKGIEVQGNGCGGGCGCGCGGGCAVGYFNINNCLFSRVSEPLIGTSLAGTAVAFVTLNNATVDHASQLAIPSSTCGITLTVQAQNSIFANVTSMAGVAGGVTLSGSYNAFLSDGSSFGSPNFPLSTSPFQSIGAGNYYLTYASGLQDSGVTNGLPAALRTDLTRRTTYPPWTIANTTLITNLVLVPQAGRDTNAPDLGYHYDPVDYAFGNVYASNATVSASGGVVLATFGTNNSAYGLGWGPGSVFSSIGTPNNPDWIVLFNTVMEGTNANWQRLTNSMSGELLGATPAPAIYTRFTSWSVLAQDSAQFYAPTNTGPIAFQDSEFHGGKLISYRPTIDLTNCLLERVYASLATADGNSPYIRNNLFLGGTFNFAPNVTNSFVEDNLFDQTVIPTNSSIYTTYNGGYNAFVTNNNRLLPTFVTDKILTNSPNYLTGPLGFYYQPTNSGLINIGHTNANFVGLYHFTVMTNLSAGLEIKETNSVVDIGYHYVATDAYGNPIDTDGDGIPDYLEDVNGNGLVDNGESAWCLSIVAQPTNQMVIQGNNALFKVSVAGTGAIHYQWYFNGGGLVGVTNVTFGITNVQPDNVGNYVVEVSNSLASVISWAAALDIGVPPGISEGPANLTGIQGDDLIFSVTATGTEPLIYQWRFNATNVILGATNASLTLSNVQATNGGTYSVSITNLFGATTSSNAILTVVSGVRLGYWRFNNTNTWVGEAGQMPLSTSNLIGITGWSTNAVKVDNLNPALLVYRTVETGGITNIDCREGSIRFWFKPDWSGSNAGGAGLNAQGRLVEMGNQTVSNGWWALTFNTNGTQITFGTQTNGLAMTNLTAPIWWVSNVWHQVVLTYSAIGCALYLDGQVAGTNGIGIIDYPNAQEQTNGFRLGSNAAGRDQAQGAFDELETFNYPLPATVIASNYQALVQLDQNGDGLPDIWEVNNYGQLNVTNVTVLTGLEGWWPGENNAQDATGFNPVGTVEGTNMTYATGEAGNAFNFGGNSDVHVAASPSLDVGGKSGGLTIECWIKPQGTNFYNGYSVVESDGGSSNSPAAGLMVSVYSVGDIYAYFSDTNGSWHEIMSEGGLVNTNGFYHLALTYDAASGEAALYCNGTRVALQNLGSFRPLTCQDFYWGYSASWSRDYQGLIDELAVYNRALSGSEIGLIYDQGNQGKSAVHTTVNIIAQPASQTVALGSSAMLTVAAEGTLPLNYQWSWNGTNLASGTNAFLSITNFQASQAGNYGVVVTNAFGSVTSSNAVLAAGQPPTIITAPTNQVAAIEGSASFFTVASGTSPLEYQWMFNGLDLVGATNATLTITNIQTNQLGYYAVYIYNGFGLAVSSNASLTFTSTNSIPASGLVAWWRGENNALDSAGTNNGALNGTISYTGGVAGQAFNCGGGSVQIADNPNFILTNSLTIVGWIKPTANGNCIFWRGDARPGLDPYSLSMQGTSNNVAFAISDASSNSAVISANIGFNQWNQVAATLDDGASLMSLYVNGVLISQTNTTIRPLGVLISGDHPGLGIGDVNDGYFHAQFYGSVDELALYSRALSQAEIQAIYSTYAPLIILQPENQAVAPGNTANFDVTATGSAPLAYQWYFNGSARSGATGSALTVTNVQSANDGDYYVVITNVAGSVTSSIVTLNAVNTVLDSDYDGRNDNQEVIDGTDPYNPSSVLTVNLGYWSFNNTNTWAHDAVYPPLLATNIQGVPGLMTNAVLIDSTNPAILRYRETETNGDANINLRAGTIRFWFKPDWNSTNAGGTGPGSMGRLVEVGDYNPAFTNGWWGLYVNPSGTQLSLGSSTNGAGSTYFTANISWVSNQWYLIDLTYTPTNTVLYLNLQVATNGAGVAYYPNATERSTSGLHIGGDAVGHNQARGTFDELETFNYAFSPSQVDFALAPDPFASVESSVFGSPTPPCVPHYITLPMLYPSFYYPPVLPEPIVTNETLKIDGSILGRPGIVRLQQIGDICLQFFQYKDFTWSINNAAINWTADLLSSDTQIAAGTANSPIDSNFEISFVPFQAGDEQVEIGFRATTGNPLPDQPVRPASPNPTILPIAVFPRERLIRLAFDNISLAGDGGQLPVIAQSVTSAMVPSPFGQGIDFSSANMELKYPAFQADAFSITQPDGSVLNSTGTPNVRRNSGTIIFWFKPNWASGSGPANGVFLDTGSANWKLQVTDAGSKIELDAAGSVLFSLPISWTNPSLWHQIAVTYSQLNTVLYVDGQPVGTGTAMGYLGYNALNYLLVGSDGGNQEIQGIMDEIQTFNYQMAAADIANIYTADCALDADGDGISDLTEFEEGINPSDPPAQKPPSDTSDNSGTPVIDLEQPINAH